MVEKLREVLESNLPMTQKMDKVKELIKEMYQKVDTYDLIETLMDKRFSYKSKGKIEELEILAIEELLEERIETISPVDQNLLTAKINIKERLLEEEIEANKKKLLPSESIMKNSEELTKKDLNYKRVMYNYYNFDSTNEEDTIANNLNRKVSIERGQKQIELLEKYKKELNRPKNLSK